MNRPIWKWALIVGLPWTLIMVTFRIIVGRDNGIPGLLVTIFAGMVFGVLFGVTVRYLTTKLYNSILIDLHDGETMIKQDAANYSADWRPAVGGKLVLTNKRLIFKTHNRNSRSVEEYLDLNNITAVSQATGILKNKIIVETNDQRRHVFILDAPGDWSVRIEQQKSGRS